MFSLIVIVDYEIQFRVVDSAAPWETFVETDQSAATTATVDSLSNGIEYEFRIFAVNTVPGKSIASAVYPM